MKKRILILIPVLMASSLQAQPPADRPPPPPGGERPGRRQEGDTPGGPGRAEAVERWLNVLKEKSPEEYKRLSTLRREDPEAFREQMRERVQHLRKRMENGAGEPPPPRLREEVQAVRNATTPEDREAAVQALRVKISAVMDERLNMREMRIKQIREDLQRLEAQHAADKADRGALVERHLQKMLEDPPGD